MRASLDMMSEIEEKGLTSASINPFDDQEQETEIEVATPVSTNPFESEEVEAAASHNPFEEEDSREFADNKEDYKCVSLDAPVVGLNRMKIRDWDLEWDHVSSAVKRNFSSISVVAPELISSMMSK